MPYHARYHRSHTIFKTGMAILPHGTSPMVIYLTFMFFIFYSNVLGIRRLFLNILWRVSGHIKRMPYTRIPTCMAGFRTGVA